MELDEVFSRLIRRHLVLLLVCLLLPVGAVVALTRTAPPQFQAATRILVSNDVPTSAVAAESLADRVQAIATDPATVLAALTSVKLQRDAGQVAAHDVTSAGLGSSPVVELRVTDRSAVAAQRLTQALANEVVAALNRSGQGSLPQALATIDKSIDDLSSQWAKLGAQLKANPQRPDAPLLTARQAGLDRQIADLAAERSRLTVSDAVRTRAVVTGNAAVPARPVSQSLPQKVALALLGGLLVGLLLVAVLETARPTLPTLRAVSRFFAAPVLGTVNGFPRSVDRAALGRLRDRLWLAALQADSSTVVLAGPLPDEQLADLARRLDQPPPMQRPADGPVAMPSAHGARANAVAAARTAGLAAPPLRVVTLDSLDGEQAGASVAMAVVAPGAVRRAEAESLQDLLVTSGWPLLGVVAVTGKDRGRHTEALS